MQKRICPICDHVMTGRHFCRFCKQWIREPHVVNTTYYLNERHPENEKNCSYHSPSGDEAPARLAASKGRSGARQAGSNQGMRGAGQAGSNQGRPGRSKPAGSGGKQSMKAGGAQSQAAPVLLFLVVAFLLLFMFGSFLPFFFFWF